MGQDADFEDSGTGGSWTGKRTASGSLNLLCSWMDARALWARCSADRRWEAIAEGRDGNNLFTGGGDTGAGTQGRSEHEASGLHCHPPFSFLKTLR